jgi:hypothetical protein
MSGFIQCNIVCKNFNFSFHKLSLVINNFRSVNWSPRLEGSIAREKVAEGVDAGEEIMEHGPKASLCHLPQQVNLFV